MLREKYRNDEECYWVLYYTYLSSQEIGCIDEIAEKLSEIFRYFSKSTYYRKKRECKKDGRFALGVQNELLLSGVGTTVCGVATLGEIVSAILGMTRYIGFILNEKGNKSEKPG